MTPGDDTPPIEWRLHLAASPATVHRMLATDDGRARFWAESAVERDGAITFAFSDGQTWRGTILADEPPHRFAVVYFGGSTTTFVLADDGAGGTDLRLTDAGVAPADRLETTAGWVSVRGTPWVRPQGRRRLRRRPPQPRPDPHLGAGLRGQLIVRPSSRRPRGIRSQ